jgi:hypothetical protein
MLFLVVIFVLVNLIMYIVQQIKFYKGEYLPDTGMKSDVRLEELFSDVTLGNARTALSFTPVVALIINFMVLRAYADDVDRNSKNWTTTEMGVTVVTVGILIQALDSFTVAFKSTIVSGISEGLGTLLTYTGYLFLITGMFVVRNTVIPMTVSAKCFVAIATLVFVTLVVAKIFQLRTRFEALNTSLGPMSDLITEHKLEEIQSASEFAPVLMVLYFYYYFRYKQIGEVTTTAEVGMIGTVVGLAIVVVALTVKEWFERAAFWLRLAGVLVLYIFLTIAIVEAIHDGWPAPSFAIEGVLLLMLAMALLKLVTITLQEISSNALETDDEESREKVAKLTKLFQDMDLAVRYGLISCVLLLYIHFRAQFILHVEPDTFVEDLGYLKEMIVLLLVCIYLQMATLVVEIGVGPNPVISTLVTLTIAGTNVALAAVTFAAVSS